MKKPKSVDIVVGKRVRLRRVAIKMSQQELAKSLRITFQQVQKYEAGQNRLSVERIIKLADVLQISAIEIIDPGARVPSK